MSIKLHPRYHVVQAAGIELSEFMVILTEKYDLTDGEIVRLMADQTANAAKYIIRDERHPGQPGKEGDRL